MGDSMNTRSETQVTPEGARIEVGTIAHEGREFAALGSVIDTARGVVVGYVMRKPLGPPPDGSATTGWWLTTWDGQYVAALHLSSTWEVRRVSHRGEFVCYQMSSWSCVIAGRRYTGRNAGEGMVLSMRARSK
jgi:hypothetical protein